jgi:hypothetical protein
MPKAEQSPKQLDDEYDKWKVYREIDTLHRRINDILVNPIWVDVTADLTTDYEAGDLDSEAKIITAVNSTNTKINALANALNAILAKIRLT